MAKKVSPDDLTVEELRRLLIEKRRKIRQEKLEHFRRTGRVVTLASDYDSSSMDNLRSDVVEEPEAEDDAQSTIPGRKRIFDVLLLVIEVLAVLGLIFIIYNGLGILRELNAESVQAQVLPTFTPTPILIAVVLPSGHTPPDSPGGAAPNEAEIPEHLRPLVQSFASLPIPTPGPEHAIRIQIPAIGVDAPIVQGDGWEQLKKGVGQHIGSVNPGTDGNVVLSAHNDVFGQIFRDLDLLKPGDQVILHTAQRSYTYLVSSQDIVEPTQVEFMDSTNQATTTLISCYPYMIDNKRIVVHAILQNRDK